ncbi:MAG: hypothetical protein J3K34DRAFT_14025 [Monoraphidium minutum]|nr:MAG: hypothetical protein J3K34DRAFT_14025 [Monoraphidium minutum]
MPMVSGPYTSTAARAVATRPRAAAGPPVAGAAACARRSGRLRCCCRASCCPGSRRRRPRLTLRLLPSTSRHWRCWGWAAPASASCREPTLVYAPCCPRDVYSSLLAANWSAGALTQLALISTSLASQAASSSLVTALEGGGGGGLSNLSGPYISSSGCGPSGSTALGKAGLGGGGGGGGGPGGGDGGGPGGGGGRTPGGGVPGGELHSLLQARGGAVEALLPDAGGAHGVATAVHLFPRAALLRTGLFS